MLGQKIVEHRSDVLPEPPTGLTVRRLKSANLRIVTEGDALWPSSSADHANSQCPPSGRRPYVSLRTPDTSHTFGRPNPTMLHPSHPSSASSRASTPASVCPSAALLAVRRHSRYSQAETALRSAVEASSSQVSPQELQIRILEKATAMLSEQARDAQTCAVKLRGCLAVKDENGLSPEEVKSMQRTCWMEERRSSARQGQSALTRNLLTKLCTPISEAPPPLLEAPPAAMTRREVNLARFLQLSPTRVTFPSHSRSPSYSRNPSTSPTYVYRRQTISQVQPMRLRPSALELALRSPINVHVRSRSLDGNHSRRNSGSSEATLVSEDPKEQLVTAQPRNGLQLKLSQSSLVTGPAGVIRIEKAPGLRPRDTLLLEVGDVSLPEYAVGLLRELATPSPDFALSPHTPSSTIRFRLSHDEPPSRASFAFPEFLKFHDDEQPARPHVRAQSPSAHHAHPHLHILSRLRNSYDVPPPASSKPTPRPPTANAHVRATFTQSLNVAPTSSGSRFSPFRRTAPTPSLVTVPESDADPNPTPNPRPESSMSAYAFGNRPQSSMSGYALDHRSPSSMSAYVVVSQEAIAEHEDGEGEGEGVVNRRRFSLASFRPRKVKVGVVGSDSADSVSSTTRETTTVRRGRVQGPAQGLIARFKRRIAGLGH